MAVVAAALTGFGGAAPRRRAGRPAGRRGRRLRPGDGLTRYVVPAAGSSVTPQLLAALTAQDGVDSAQQLFDGSALVAADGATAQQPRAVPGVTPVEGDGRRHLRRLRLQRRRRAVLGAHRRAQLRRRPGGRQHDARLRVGHHRWLRRLHPRTTGWATAAGRGPTATARTARRTARAAPRLWRCDAAGDDGRAERRAAGALDRIPRSGLVVLGRGLQHQLPGRHALSR